MRHRGEREGSGPEMMDITAASRRRRPAATERGAVAIAVALLMSPLLGMAALAVDYGRGLHARTVLQGAVDAAALSVRAYQEELRSGRVGWPEVEAVARRLAVAVLVSHRFAGALVWTQRSGATLWVSASTTIETAFARVLGTPRFEVRARAWVTVSMGAPPQPGAPPEPGGVSPEPGGAPPEAGGPPPSEPRPPGDVGENGVPPAPDRVPDLPAAPGAAGTPEPLGPAQGIPSSGSPPDADTPPPADAPPVAAAAAPATSSAAPSRSIDDFLVAGTDFAYVRDRFTGEEYGLNTRTGATERLSGTPAFDNIPDSYRGSGSLSPAAGDYGDCDGTC